MGIDLRCARGTNILLDFLGEHCKIVLRDRTSLACLADSTDDLDAAEWFADAGPLDHGQAGGFHCGEATSAFRALASAADG